VKREARVDILIFLLFTSLWGVYLLTVCPTVYLGDSGELIAAAFSLGIPHNPGYPLYCLLGKLFCLIPVGNIAFRMNLMMSFFAVLAVWLVYSLILRWTSSQLAGLVAAGVLAFSPVFWLETVCAKFYPLHSFFVALLMNVLLWWDQKKEFYGLIVLVLLTGFSFGNHMQTVMLAPAVLWMVFSGDRRALLDVRRFLILSGFFLAALSVYVYLPIRTDAGAAIHWGDPNSLHRFLAHVSGSAHRSAYVFNLSGWDYLKRSETNLWLACSAFGLILLLALWGWLKLVSKRWQCFFVLLVVFDFFYAIFLNTVSLEVTPFMIATAIGLAFLMGVGIADMLRRVESLSVVGRMTKRLIRGACGVVPVIFMTLNFSLCDQSRNYTGYEQALNMLRTTQQNDILFVSGDNYVFPVTYGRLVERMREDVNLYDRYNLIFQMPSMEFQGRSRTKAWEEKRDQFEKDIITERGRRDVFYGSFGPYAINMPERYTLVPYGVLHKVVKEKTALDVQTIDRTWEYYATESLHESFYRDYMNREVSAFFYFSRGKHLIFSGQASRGLEYLRLAATIGYDDTLIPSETGIFLTDHGYYEEARQALERAMTYNEDLSGVYNNWGYYYHRIGDLKKAVASFKKAVELKPERFSFYNNLGFALYELGDKTASKLALKQSLAINEEQPEIKSFLRDHFLKEVHEQY
jgi:tetratricopeptide (TPR) repeat protein